MSLKKKIRSNQLTVGSWMTIGHPAVAEIMAKAGFEWLAIDMEHSPLSMAQCQELIRTADLCGVPPLVRVGANDPLLIKQAMDSGANGVIVPMINSVEEAERAVASVQYPPKGKRGVGLARAQGYGADFERHREWVKRDSVVIVQIEDARALPSLEKIFSVEGVDAFLIGPYDLSGSLGKPGDFESKEFLKAMDQILKTAERCKIPAGIHVVSSDEKKVVERIKQGYKVIAYGVDFLFLQENCRKGNAVLRAWKKDH